MSAAPAVSALPLIAQAISGIALVAGGLAFVVTRRPAVALGVFLDFLLAAGLLRLAGDAGGQALAIAAVIVLIRRLVSSGLRMGGRSLTWARGPQREGAAGELLRRLARPAWRL